MRDIVLTNVLGPMLLIHAAIVWALGQPPNVDVNTLVVRTVGSPR